VSLKYDRDADTEREEEEDDEDEDDESGDEVGGDEDNEILGMEEYELAFMMSERLMDIGFCSNHAFSSPWVSIALYSEP
jgi:hypothetical protein